MSEEETEENLEEEEAGNAKPPESTGNGCAAATAAYKEVYRATRDHRLAVRAYCGNNRWAIENAKGTGNW
jgi:hypothetical protein